MGPKIKILGFTNFKNKQKGNLKRTKENMSKRKWSTVTHKVGRSKTTKIKNVHWTYQQKLVTDLGINSYSGQSKSLNLP